MKNVRNIVNLTELSKRASLYSVGENGVLAIVSHKKLDQEFAIIYILKQIEGTAFEVKRAFGINKKYINFIFDSKIENEIKLVLK